MELIKINENENYQITLTGKDISVIMTALHELPAKISISTILSIIEQMKNNKKDIE